MSRHQNIISRLFEEGTFPHDAFYIDRVLGGRKIIVYGAGEGFHWVDEIVMRIYGYVPSVVLDRAFSPGQNYLGIPAFSPLDYKPDEEEKRDAIVIITVGKTEYHEEIINCLKEMGFKNILLIMDIYEVHNPLRLSDELEQKGFDYYLQQRENILSCLDLFADEESRDIYVGCLQTHIRRKPVPLPSRPRNEQYFPKDIQLNRGYAKFINCGAYDGDTVRLLQEVHGKVDELVCFETEPVLFKRLVEYLRQNKSDLADQVIAFPCAAYSREAIMPFASGGGLGSRVAENGDVMIQTVALDSVLPGFTPTFICMDVEGAEPEVLKGAEKMIRANRPDLGISVYHAPHHLWQIPLYLKSLNLHYRFYLRNYTTFITETVLYATT